MKEGSHRRTDKGVSRAAATLCIGLIFLTGFISAVHFHADSSASEKACSVCALAHAGVVPVALGAPAPVFASTETFECAAATSHSLLFVSSIYIRPPPAA